MFDRYLPFRPVTLVLSSQPGGANDPIARLTTVLATFTEAEYARCGKVSRSAGIKPD